MMTDYMRSTLEPGHRLMTLENKHCCVTDKKTLDSLEDRKSEINNDEKDADNQEADQKKKPRRKDTPVLNSPPHIPGVKLLKAKEQMVHLEDEEKEMRD